jgi:hypothetical protein
MPVVSKTSSAARLAVIYITVGALTVVWSAIYYLFLHNHPDGASDVKFYWCYGFLLSGLTVLLIGLLLGPIGHSVKPAEVAAPGVTAPDSDAGDSAPPQPAAPPPAQIIIPTIAPPAAPAPTPAAVVPAQPVVRSR